eukprot:Blabericola_migrator_1__4191@NODE_2284_length_2998_cov_36_750597_g1434_i0_p1_GENE_NODE_2284_length_2998_cov_36_750597_g1434_i0NODE_2284_length_2998_cov_36_750597_g1434_i0_p1_ORF_typecomplete_len687_score76_15_NODE_2284_length_2998_cov_36_750597_g1434_i01372197
MTRFACDAKQGRQPKAGASVYWMAPLSAMFSVLANWPAAEAYKNPQGSREAPRRANSCAFLMGSCWSGQCHQSPKHNDQSLAALVQSDDTVSEKAANNTMKTFPSDIASQSREGPVGDNLVESSESTIDGRELPFHSRNDEKTAELARWSSGERVAQWMCCVLGHHGHHFWEYEHCQQCLADFERLLHRITDVSNNLFPESKRPYHKVPPTAIIYPVICQKRADLAEAGLRSPELSTTGLSMPQLSTPGVLTMGEAYASHVHCDWSGPSQTTKNMFSKLFETAFGTHRLATLLTTEDSDQVNKAAWLLNTWTREIRRSVCTLKYLALKEWAGLGPNVEQSDFQNYRAAQLLSDQPFSDHIGEDKLPASLKQSLLGYCNGPKVLERLASELKSSPEATEQLLLEFQYAVSALSDCANKISEVLKCDLPTILYGGDPEAIKSRLKSLMAEADFTELEKSILQGALPPSENTDCVAMSKEVDRVNQLLKEKWNELLSPCDLPDEELARIHLLEGKVLEVLPNSRGIKTPPTSLTKQLGPLHVQLQITSRRYRELWTQIIPPLTKILSCVTKAARTELGDVAGPSLADLTEGEVFRALRLPASLSQLFLAATLALDSPVKFDIIVYDRDHNPINLHVMEKVALQLGDECKERLERFVKALDDDDFDNTFLRLLGFRRSVSSLRRKKRSPQ